MTVTDPDTLLKELLPIANRVLRTDGEHPTPAAVKTMLTDAVLLAERLIKLDDWLRRGGDLPRAWVVSENVDSFRTAVDIIRLACIRTHHGPSGKGEDGPCREDCVKCSAITFIKNFEQLMS